MSGRVWPRVVVSTGVLLLVAGFIYDVIFAGIPYQDPTPELAAAYARHAGIAAMIRWVGLGVAVAGASGSVGRRLIRRREERSA